MLTLLGTGQQYFDTSMVMTVLLKKIEYLLTTSNWIEEVSLVVYRDQDVEILNSNMNTILGRKSSIFKQNQILDAVTGGLKNKISNYRQYLSRKIFDDVQSVLKEKDIDALKLAIISRKVCEFIINSLIKDNVNGDLSKKINYLRSTDTPVWVITYFHFLRVFGNTHAHESSSAQLNHFELEDHDIVIRIDKSRKGNRILHKRDYPI